MVCKCKSRRCFCDLAGNAGITIEGNGGGRNPYLPEWMRYTLLGSVTSQSTVTVTGDGSTGSPWVITVTTNGGAITQTVYTSDDTWEKQAGELAQIVVIGGGGGGGGVANFDVPGGGSGGSGGAMSVAWLALIDLPDEVPIQVGRGGRGGQPVAGETTARNGGDSWFGPYLYAPGGWGGKSQASPSQTQRTTLGGTPPDGGPGGAGAVRNGLVLVPASDHRNFFSPTGGGMGEGASMIASPPGEILPGLSWGGNGGGGAILSITPSGLDGVDFGGGGGGAGSPPPGDPLGNGGNGAPGVVVVTVW